MTTLSLEPKEVVEYIVKLGKTKIEKKFKVLLLQGIMAGMFIAIGAIAYINVYAKTSDPGIGHFLASAVFPVGIMTILVLGFELVTSNVLATIGVYSKIFKLRKVLKMLAIVWLANLVGSVLIALLAKGANMFTPQMVSVINAMAETKVNLSFWEMFLRGVLCNILVCSGVMMALTSKDSISKMAAVWLSIVVFLLCGAEHIVANMFYLPMAYLVGADISILGIIYNFIFVSAGNYVGGAIIIGGVSYMTHLRLAKN